MPKDLQFLRLDEEVSGVTVRAPTPRPGTSPRAYCLRVKVVVGIDPGTAACGYGIVHESDGRLRALDYGWWKTAAGEAPARRLKTIFEGVAGLIEEHAPAAVVLEESFVGADARTALSVGRGAGPCSSRPPWAASTALNTRRPGSSRRSAATGAPKAQVQRMVQMILALPASRRRRAADALAVAICHARITPLLRVSA